MKMFTDMEGLSTYEQRRLRDAIAAFSPEASIIESDSRSVRHIDPAIIGLAVSTVSAVCSVISLVLQAIQAKRNDGTQPQNDEHDRLIVYAETALSVNIPSQVKTEIKQKLLAGGRPPFEIDIDMRETSYRISVMSVGDAYSLIGRIDSVKR